MENSEMTVSVTLSNQELAALAEMAHKRNISINEALRRSVRAGVYIEHEAVDESRKILIESSKGEYRPLDFSLLAAA